MEKNIEKFVYCFLDENERQNLCKLTSCVQFRENIKLYKLFTDLARDLRSTEYVPERASSFQMRAKNYYKKFKETCNTACYGRKPYMHVLTDHISEFMIFWGEHLNWGYGYFNTNSGEHLNKRIKTMEFDCTNMDSNRFE